MKEDVGVVRFRPAPDFERLCAIVQEDPREVIAQGKHFLAHASADRLTQARTYNLMCYTSARILKRADVEAVFHGHEAVRLVREEEGPEARALLFDHLVNQGVALERIGEYERAMDCYREALSMPLDWLERRHQEETVLIYLGRSLYLRGRHTEALATLDQAGHLAMRRHDSYAIGLVQNLRGRCYMRMGDVHMAEHFLTLAVAATNDETRYALRMKCRLLGSLAVLRLLSGHYAEASEYAQSVLALATDLQEARGLVEGQMVQACYARAQRRVQEAMEHCAAAGRVAFERGNVPLVEEWHWLMGKMLGIV